MIKKNYILIADAIKEVYEYQKDSDGKGSKALKQGAIRMVCYNLADSMIADNPLFNREKFYKACGIN